MLRGLRWRLDATLLEVGLRPARSRKAVGFTLGNRTSVSICLAIDPPSALSWSLLLCLSLDHALRESKGSTTSAKRYLQPFHLPKVVFQTACCLYELIKKTKDSDAELLRM